MDLYNENKCDYLYYSFKNNYNMKLEKIKKIRELIKNTVRRRMRDCKHLNCEQCKKRWIRAYNAVVTRSLPKPSNERYKNVNIIAKNEKRCLLRRRNHWASLELKWTALVYKLVNKKIFAPIYNKRREVTICTMCWDPSIKHHLPIDNHIYPLRLEKK